MNRRFQFAVVASSTALVCMLLIGAVRGRSAATDGPYTHLGVYSEVLSRIKQDYVEEPDMKAVTAGAINGMLESLDPYASYLTPGQFAQYQKSKETPKADVGLILSRRFGYLTIVDAVPGSPAAKAGLGTGDVVETINKVSTRDMPLAFSQMLMQGDAASTIELSVLRTRRSEPQTITLTRVNIVYPTLSAKLVTDSGEPIGVIATSTLSKGRAKEIAEKVADLQKQGAKKFVLDLRHCATGDPAEGIAVANVFLDKGEITYLQGQRQPKRDFQADPSKIVTKEPLVVIVNRGTAGPAEIAAEALLDAKRADVVGERTFGDAAERKPITMDDGGAVILSVAKYYAPATGKAIQDTGVTPNVAQTEADAASDGVDDDTPDTDTPKPAGPDMLMRQAIGLANKKS